MKYLAAAGVGALVGAVLVLGVLDRLFGGRGVRASLSPEHRRLLDG